MAYRVQPRVWIGVLVAVAYVVLVQVMQHLTGVPYPDLAKSAGNLFLGVGVSLIIGTLLLALTTTALGWWQPAMHERHRSPRRWPIVAPLLVAGLAVLNLLRTDWDAYSAGFLAASLVLLLVGFTEEIAFRGLLVVGLRSRLAEGWVWFVSSALFGLAHGTNVFNGQALGPTVVQVLDTFVFGTAMYILRRVTGTLLWAMLLHGLWDFASLAAQQGTATELGFQGLLSVAVDAFALVAVVWVVRSSDEQPGGRQPGTAVAADPRPPSR